ncbi:HD-GYP domain-containing protein [Oceanobacillus sp. FSL K6-2867]|uniref:HD-GYP domain-containing protein n=1 Tax=Oceanobacillus sp. FSL K6-2867 TaxID=2954748 RepID=UPI0030D8E204
MRVEPSQLIPGCVLLKEVRGKTNRPIIPEHTVLTEKHIVILEKFLVESVDVASTLSNGETFQGRPVQKKEKQQVKRKNTYDRQKTLPFAEHYIDVATAYKQQFQKWQNGMPIDISIVRKLIMPLLERTETMDTEKIYRLHTYSTKEDYIYFHSVAVSLLSAFIGRKMGLSKGEWLQSGIAGLLSNCGMARLDFSTLTKKGTLTPGEWKEFKNHPTYSYRMIEHLPTITAGVKLGVLQHHERLDGTGYPLGITNEKIHLFAKLIAVSDTYVALTSERMHAKRKNLFQAIEVVEKDKYMKLDAQVLNILIDNFAHFSIGLDVILSNGKHGEIVFMETTKPTKPMIRITEDDTVISLEQMPELYIKEIVGS